jgi:hypothetical protein
MSDLTRRTASGRSQSARPLPYIVGGAGISAHIDIDHPVMGGPADRLRAWARAPNEADTRAPGASSALTVRARDAHRALPGLRHTVRPQDRHPAKSLTQGIAHASNKHLSPVNPGFGPAICRGFFDAYAARSRALVLLSAFRRLTEVEPPARPAPGRRKPVIRACAVPQLRVLASVAVWDLLSRRSSARTATAS